MSEIPPPPAVPPSTPPPAGSGSYTPPPPPPPPPLTGGPIGGGPSAPGDGDRMLMLILSYCGPLAVIPLMVKKDDSEVQWHAKNGLAIFGAEMIVCVIFWILLRIPFIGCGAYLLSCLVPIMFLAVFVYCVIQVLNGKRPRIPVISDFADKM